MIDPISAAIGGFILGFFAHTWIVERMAERRFRCEVCGSETTPDGIGASAALGDDMENWGRDR